MFVTLCCSYLRGSHVRFMILPDMLKHAPMFNRIDPKQGPPPLNTATSLVHDNASSSSIPPPALVFKSCVLHHCSTLLLAGVLRGKGVGVDRGRGGRGRGGMRGR